MRKKITQYLDALKNITVLYVEDDPGIQGQLSHFLESAVLTLYLAANGQEGLEKYREYKPDLVITDIKMPVMDGLEMAESIREINQDVPIIVTTAYNETDYLLKAIDIGIDKFVSKPIDPYALLEALRKCAVLLNQKKELELQQRYVHFIVDVNPSFMIITNQNDLEYINKTFLDFLGYSSIYDFRNEQKRLEDFFCRIEGTNSSYQESRSWLKYIIDHPEKDILIHFNDPKGQKGDTRVFLVSYNRFPERDKYVFTFTDISNIEKEKKELKKQAITDVLTGVFNRKKLLDDLDSAIHRTIRYQRPLSLIMFDIDHFKDINDTYGHGVGDTVLKKITGIVSENIREPDTLTRWGGDEFLILAPETSLDEAVKLAGKLCLFVNKCQFSQLEKVTCSFGVTQFKAGDNQDSFIKRADQALYRSKKNGRSRVESL